MLASYADPIGGGGWHRAVLLDVAIDRFHEWWLLGYKLEDPGWVDVIGMTWTDITNHYLVAGVKYGIFGMISLIGMLVYSVCTVVKIHNSTGSYLIRSWCSGL